MTFSCVIILKGSKLFIYQIFCWKLLMALYFYIRWYYTQLNKKLHEAWPTLSIVQFRHLWQTSNLLLCWCHYVWRKSSLFSDLFNGLFNHVSWEKKSPLQEFSLKSTANIRENLILVLIFFHASFNSFITEVPVL